MNDKGVCRTAPATPGLLNIEEYSKLCKSMQTRQEELVVPICCANMEDNGTYLFPLI